MKDETTYKALDRVWRTAHEDAQIAIRHMRERIGTPGFTEALKRFERAQAAADYINQMQMDILAANDATR